MGQTRRIHGPPALRIVGSVFLLVAFVGLIAAAALAYAEYSSGRSARADGMIIGFAYGPVVQFTPQNGETAQFHSTVRSTFWNVGDHVPVAYDPRSPAGAQIDGLAGRWFLSGLFGLLSGVFLLVGGGLATAGLVGRTEQ